MERLIPYLPIFPYNPEGARLIGSPMDIIVFHGADEGMVEEIAFLEVRTGESSLSSKRRMIRDAVLSGRVVWREFRV